MSCAPLDRRGTTRTKAGSFRPANASIQDCTRLICEGTGLKYTVSSAFLSPGPVLASSAHKSTSVERHVVHRPAVFSAFEFAVLSGLRAAQLMRGCIPRVEGTHKTIVTAQLEVAAGKIGRAANHVPVLGE